MKHVEPANETYTCPGCGRLVLILLLQPRGTRTTCRCGRFEWVQA